MIDQTILLAWSCIFLGLGLSGYALHALRSGHTRGYYRSDQYDAEDDGPAYDRWVWGRMVLGLVCLFAGIAFI